jgi:hypothetical protein
MIETNNTLTHPTGPEFQLVVGEGEAWRNICNWIKIEKNGRNIHPQRRPSSCYAAAASLGGPNHKSKSSRNNTPTSNRWD